jgi:hypothetical protein
MAGTRLSRTLLPLLLLACNFAGAESAVPKGDPLAAIDLSRNAIIADIVEGFEGDRPALAKRLSALRADHLLSASLASTRESLEAILREGEKSRDREVNRAGAKVLGSANSDLTYTPITPCRLIDTRGFGAPIQGGPFAPNERRAYVPNGLCGLPTSGVASMLISFTTLNLTPNSGGYLSILGPGAPVSTTVDIFNIGAAWSASNTAVATGPAAQFDVFVSTANPQVVIDILGYFAPPQGGAVTSITAGAGLTGGTITTTGTIGLAATNLLPTTACAANQIPKWSGSAWACAADNAGSGGGVTSVATGTGLTGGPITGTGTVSVADLGIGTALLADNAVTFQKLADGSVGSSKLASGSVGSTQIDSFSVQRRVSALCSRGVPMIGINQDGTPICDNPARTLAFTTNRVSVAIRADGRPLLARDGGSLYDCADVNCTSGTDVAVNAGLDVSMALRSDGRAVMAVGSASVQSLVICGDTTCSPGLRVVRTLDTGNLGLFSGVALRADNTPLVTYFEFNTGQTRLYVCNDPTCASGTIRTITASPSYTPSGIRIRSNGSPMIALRDYVGFGGNGLYDCNDAACSSGSIRALGSGGSIRFLLGLAVRSDNRAIVVGVNNSGPVLHDCADSVCSSNVARPFDTGGSISASAAVIRGDGRPLLAYGGYGGQVKLFDCADAACTSGTVRIVDQVPNSFSDQEISLALRADGRAVLAYPVGSSGGLRLLSCQNTTCQ